MKYISRKQKVIKWQIEKVHNRKKMTKRLHLLYRIWKYIRESTLKMTDGENNVPKLFSVFLHLCH